MLTDDVRLLTSLLRKVYESQTARCIGSVDRENPRPCGACIWCRVATEVNRLEVREREREKRRRRLC